jgi:hypothetical protein
MSEVRDARRVFVLWSRASILAHDVVQYALAAYHAGTLIPIMLERVKPPAPFDRVPAADLSSWNADFQHRSFVSF